MRRTYRCFSDREFLKGKYKLIPVRDEDKYCIMKWRNDQIDILRQKQPLSEGQQELYFKNVVDKLFDQEKPDQLLFSFFEVNKLIGYGGLVHIDWESRNAEVSFLTQTDRASVREIFLNDWKNYLSILKKIVIEELKLRKVFTYSYDVRSALYEALLFSGFIEEARLKQHILVKDCLHDVLIHSCFLNGLSFRMATKVDSTQYLEWANDLGVRENSYQPGKISKQDHEVWFNSKLTSENSKLYFFLSNGTPAGQVRVEKVDNEMIISISVDGRFRAQGLSSQMLTLACNDYLNKFPNKIIVAYIKITNFASYKSFLKAGFKEIAQVEVSDMKSYKLIKNDL